MFHEPPFLLCLVFRVQFILVIPFLFKTLKIKIAHYGSEDEIFSWKNKEHEELFINEHVKLAELGFEAFFIDSAIRIVRK